MAMVVAEDLVVAVVPEIDLRWEELQMALA
jgi:hypothetical protein